MTVAAVLLAAGRSARFGEADKLLAKVDGTPLVARVAEHLLESRARPIVAVVRAEDSEVAGVLAGFGIARAVSADPDFRMGRSIAAGIAAVGDAADGAMIVPADMPGLGAEIIDALIEAFERAGRSRIVHPVLADGSQRNPVLWPRRFFPSLVQLHGAGGAKAMLAELAADVLPVAFADEEPFTDIDTREDLARYLARPRPAGGPVPRAR